MSESNGKPSKYQIVRKGPFNYEVYQKRRGENDVPLPRGVKRCWTRRGAARLIKRDNKAEPAGEPNKTWSYDHNGKNEGREK